VNNGSVLFTGECAHHRAKSTRNQISMGNKGGS
jgi:hypothetical protein